MNVLDKIIRGDAERKTRFHDEKGNFIRPGRLLRNGPRAYATFPLRRLLNVRPKQPWISFDASYVLAKHLTKDSRVLEFGSGMSTIWYAKRAGHVRSVEDYRPWYEKVCLELQADDATNVDYVFAESRESYTSAGLRGTEYDLIMVDGSHRSACIASAIPLLAARGILYLDNSDKNSRGGDVRDAEKLCLQFAERKGLACEYYTDFAPSQLIPTQGLLIRNS
jgi:hypothetical protein